MSFTRVCFVRHLGVDADVVDVDARQNKCILSGQRLSLTTESSWHWLDRLFNETWFALNIRDIVDMSCHNNNNIQVHIPHGARARAACMGRIGAGSLTP